MLESGVFVCDYGRRLVEIKMEDSLGYDAQNLIP